MGFNKILSLLFILITSTSIASKAVIKGFSKSFAGKELVVYGYSEYITESKEKLGFTTIKSDGSFNFNFETDFIQRIELKIEDKTTWFFIKPGGIYNISLSFDPNLNKKRVYDRLLSLKFNFPAPTEINQLVSKFNRKYDDFIDENYKRFIVRDRTIEPKIKEFKTKMLAEFKKYNSEFVNNYITYTIGGIFNSIDVSYNVYTSGKDSHNTKANIYTEYLHKLPVLYHNPEYNSLFKAFFEGEIKRLTKEIKGLDITKAINEESSYTALSNALSKYPFLLDDEFKSLFILNGLLEISDDVYFKRENVITILKEIEKTSKYKDQQLIASNIVKYITREKLEPGVSAPQFTLKNADGKMVSLSNYKGKYVYINFWVNWSVPSLKEMKIMNVLHKKYKNKIAFVSICVDNDIDKMTSFMKKNPAYKWDFLHIGDNKKLQEQYNVRTLPTYILIDHKQKILKAPAARPGGTAERATEDNIDKEMYDIVNKR
jgi:peroxiredoxin